MKNNCTELVFILDRSGSMAGLESDTIGGFNAMIEKQKKTEGTCWVSTVLFSDRSTVIHDRLTLEKVPPMTDREYSVGGCTALLDAIGDAVRHIGNIHKYARAEDIPEHTMFVITTERKKEEGWEFLFLGANIDAVETAKRFGIDEDRAVNYHSDTAGTALNYEVLSEAVSSVRASVPLGRKWKARIDEDFQRRKK